MIRMSIKGLRELERKLGDFRSKLLACLEMAL